MDFHGKAQVAHFVGYLAELLSCPQERRVGDYDIVPARAGPPWGAAGAVDGPAAVAKPSCSPPAGHTPFVGSPLNHRQKHFEQNRQLF
jgi:hypothetical protein